MLSGNKLHKNYIPELDGLRGIAILLVVFYHYFGSRFNVFSFGWSGVDLFFVLSGYLITSRLIATREKPGYFQRFYKNRILRIFPLYYGTLIAFYFIVPFFIPEYYYKDLAFYRQHAAAFFLFFENWTFLTHPGLSQNHLQVFWSLAVEEQFYLIWPVFILLFANSKNLKKIFICWLVLTIILRSVIYSFYPDNYYAYLYNTFCRMDAFIIGAGLYLIHEKLLKPISVNIGLFCSVILILGIAWWGTHPARSPFIATIGLICIAIFYASLIHLAIKKQYRWYISFLNWPLLIYIGRISYGLYIYHWLVLRFLNEPLSNFINQHFVTGRQVSDYISLFTLLILSFILSALSFRYFESYFLKMKSRKLSHTVTLSKTFR